MATAMMWLLPVIIGLLYGPYISVGYAPKGHPKETKTKSVEKSLIRMLLNRYEQYGVIGRPVNDSKIQVVVAYGLQLFQILDLDENKQILRTNCWGMYAWHDSLLEWNQSEYGDIKTVRIFPSQIWTPDIKLYNFADERLTEHREARVVIYSDGSTLWIPQALFKSTCEVEITYFPFDTQICMLEFGSWTYDKTQMDITWWLPDGPGTTPMPYLDFSDYVPSNEWRTDGEEERDVHHTNRTIQIPSVKSYRRRNQTFGDEVVSREYPVLRYLVRLSRNPSFYVFMLVIPCVLLSSLTLVVFWLPPESPAKMMLGMNIFVAFFVLLLLLAESTPSAVKNFPLIGVYFCLNMIMITLSTFLATLVIHLYFRGDRNGAVPAFLRRFVIEGIGRLTLVRQRIPLPDVKKTNTPRTASTGKIRRKVQNQEMSGTKFLLKQIPYPEDSRGAYYGANSQYVSGRIPVGHPSYGEHILNGRDCCVSGCQCSEMARRMTMTKCPCQLETYGGQRDAQFPPMGPYDAAGQWKEAANSSDEVEESPELMNPTVILERDVREVKRYVKMFVNRQKEIRRRGLVAMEWRTLAVVLDRLFFFLYIATIGIAVLVSVPRGTEPELPEAFRSSRE